MADEAKLWKTAVDEQSGRTYYYHTQTRETQWQKPLCLATPEERSAAIALDTSTRNFFAAMEANIMQSMNSSSSPLQQQQVDTDSVGTITRPHGLVRTISTMEDSVLADLVGRVPSNRSIPNITRDDRPVSPSFSDITEDSVSPVKQVRPRLRSFARRSTASLRGSMTRLPLGSHRMMKLVPEDIHEDLSGSSHDVIDPHFEEEEDKEDDIVHRGLERMSGTLHLEAGVASEFVPDPSGSGFSSIHPMFSRENSLSLDSLAPGSTRNVIHWTNDSFRHPSFSNDRNLLSDNSVQSSRHKSQSSMDAGFRADSTRWAGSSFYSKGGEGDETLMALAAISQEMVDVEARDEGQDVPQTPISTIDGLEGLNFAMDDDDEHDDDAETAQKETGEESRPRIARPQSLRVTPDPAISRPHMKRRNTCGTVCRLPIRDGISATNVSHFSFTLDLQWQRPTRMPRSSVFVESFGPMSCGQALTFQTITLFSTIWKVNEVLFQTLSLILACLHWTTFLRFTATYSDEPKWNQTALLYP